MSIELFEAGLIAFKEGLLWYFDNPIRIPKLVDVSDENFEQRWKIFCTILQLGDFIFVIDTKSLISRLIARFDHGTWSHVGLYSGAGNITEAIPSGVVERDIETYHNSKYRLGVYRSKPLTGGGAEKVIALARSKIGAPYGFGEFMRLAACKLLGIRPRGEGPHGPNGLARSDRLMLIHIV